MRVYFDTEFSDISKPIQQCQLLSAGLVTEHGDEFYAEITDYDLNRCSTFVQDTVLLQFDGTNSLTLAEFPAHLTDWLNALGEASILICDTDQDAQLLQRHINLEDLKHQITIKVQATDDPFRTEDLEDEFWGRPENSGMRHHALFDARCLRFVIEASK